MNLYQAIDAKRKSVAIVTKAIPHYRVALFNGLDARLKMGSTSLTVFADYALPHFHVSDGLEQVDCAIRVPHSYLGPSHLAERTSIRLPYWQPIFRQLLLFDFVILEQSNSSLLNYLLFARRRLLSKSPKIGLWGHGTNLQMREAGLRRWIKVTQCRQADHWFGYTEVSADILRRLGVNDDIITIVNNSVDTSAIKMASDMDVRLIEHRKSELQLGSSPVAVFCSRLSKNKALPFVIDACRSARERIGDFSLLVIGDGHYGPWLREQAEKESWIHPLGALYGSEKAKMLALCDVFLLPSLVGLSIIDSFAAGLPLLSARFNNHSPEIAYLKDGVNGLMTDATVDAYSDAIVRVLSDQKFRKRLSRAARQSAETNSIEAMIENVARGIEQALDQKELQYDS